MDFTMGYTQYYLGEIYIYGRIYCEHSFAAPTGRVPDLRGRFFIIIATVPRARALVCCAFVCGTVFGETNILIVYIRSSARHC